MAGFELDNQHSATIPGGVRIECGDFTNAAGATLDVPTQFTKLYGGVAYGDLTNACGGRAASLCEGPTIHFVLTDSTGMASVAYVAWGN